jgi:peptidoglycan/xylan/chitin deacetylase (PgdA/CDA1 family)
LASHTFSHISCRSVSGADFRTDVIKGGRAIEELAGLESPNFAYPYGHVTLQAKRSLELDLSSARSIFPGFNGPEVDLNLLRSNSLYGDLEGSQRAEELVLENAKRKSWLIFYTHDVRPDPSPYGCTPALLEAAASSAVRNGSRILTVHQVLTGVGVQGEYPKGQVPCGVSA